MNNEKKIPVSKLDSGIKSKSQEDYFGDSVKNGFGGRILGEGHPLEFQYRE